MIAYKRHKNVLANSNCGQRRSPGRRNGNSLQYSCLGNPMDRGAWQALVSGVAELDTTEHTHVRAHTLTHTHTHTHLYQLPEISYNRII